MIHDMHLTQLQETGTAQISQEVSLAELIEFADTLGFKPSEIFLNSGPAETTRIYAAGA